MTVRLILLGLLIASLGSAAVEQGGMKLFRRDKNASTYHLASCPFTKAQGYTMVEATSEELRNLSPCSACRPPVNPDISPRAIASRASTLAPPAAAAPVAVTVFRGLPSVKISEGGVERNVAAVPRQDAVNVACVISEIGGAYYWASRQNVLMTRVESSAFIIYLATNGAGYVRVIKPDTKIAAATMSPTEAAFDYVEHLTIGLRGVTYYGARQ